MRLDVRIRLVSRICLYDLCALSYGHFIAEKEFWSQCHTLLFYIGIKIALGSEIDQIVIPSGVPPTHVFISGALGEK